MNGFMFLGLAFCLVTLLAGCWLGWQLLRQNGRMLLRLEELEKRFDEWEFGGLEEARSANSEIQSPKGQAEQGLAHSLAAGNGDDRSARFSNRSLARSRIKRDGLKAGTSARSIGLTTIPACSNYSRGITARADFNLCRRAIHMVCGNRSNAT